MAENLNKIWAKAKPLSNYFEQLIQEMDFDESGYEERIADLRDDVSDNPTLSSLNGLTRQLIAMGRDKTKKELGITELRNRIVSEDLILIGRYENEHLDFKIVRPNEEFWLGAKIWPDTNKAELGDLCIDELRVQEKAPEAANPTLDSERELENFRQDAIRHCEAMGLVDLSGGPKSRRNGKNNILIRTDVYLTYLREKYPSENFERWGFSEKSFERSEGTYKKQKRFDR